MHIWVSTETGLTIYFHPENEEEKSLLDKALGVNEWSPTAIGCHHQKKVGEGYADNEGFACSVEKVGQLGGHENLRWITIELDEVLRNSTKK